MSAPRLGPAALAGLPASVARPGFDRSRLQPGLVHLGIGAFARALVLPFTDATIAASGDLRWGVAGVSLRHRDTRDALQPQQGLYALALRDAQGQALQVVGSLIELKVAPEDPAAVTARLAAPTTSIISLTVTEKGYCHDPATGMLDPGHPDIEHDLSHAAPRSAPGLIVRGLQRRRATGQGGVTLLSCDNLAANGDTLRRVVLALAARFEPGLEGWIDAACRFPNSMVDRIVPRTTDLDRASIGERLGVHDAWPVVGEPFADWVIEDRFAAGRPDWAAAGVRFVDDARRFETLKLRMVNGSHSALAYLGLLAGLATVDQAVGQPELRGFVDALLREEVQPTLPALPGLDLDAYRARLLQRFSNPALPHRLLQIAIDGSQKIPPRWLATVRARLQAGQGLERLALALAAWMRFLDGTNERGDSHPVDDPLAGALIAERSRAGSVQGLGAVFGDLAADPTLAAALATADRRLGQLGALQAAAALAGAG